MISTRAHTSRPGSRGPGLITALAALMLLAAACSTAQPAGGAPAGEAPAGAPKPASDGENGASVPDILDFTAPLVGGGELNGADYAGKPVAAWFWAPW